MPDFVGALLGWRVLHAAHLQPQALAPRLLAVHGLLAAGHLGVGQPDHLSQILHLPLPRGHQALYLRQLTSSNRYFTVLDQRS